MMGQSGMLQNMRMQSMNPMMSEFGRTAAESNPWFQYAMGLGGGGSNMIPQQYQPSTMSNILGGLGPLAMIAAALGWAPLAAGGAASAMF